jgi:hypothetical protein
MQVWRRGPDGTLDKPAEVADQRLSIVALGTDGAVFFAVGPYNRPASLYLSEVGQPPVLFASGWGGWSSRYGSPEMNFAKRIDGRWRLAIGGTLYALTGGTPMVGPCGQTCRTTCTLRFAAGAEVTLPAAAGKGWRFRETG